MPNSMYFVLAAVALVGGYYIYGTLVDKIFGADPERATPACSQADGVDFVQMSPKKIWLIQLLNIAGVGPIFGPILGALYGPAALLWIVLGSIFAGGVHDYFSGMLSLRYNGTNVPNIVGYNLGNFFKHLMRVFSVVLLVLVGVVFVTAPAHLLETLTPAWMDYKVWLAIIFIYYFLATIMPIDKIIGRLYPFFGAVLMIMAVGITVMLFVKDGGNFYPSAEWANQHPKGLPLWPLMFITIACGALSGFHATQSPLMSRCLPNERYGKPVFYGGMIAEGLIALVWATVGMTFYHTPADLQAALASGGPGAVVQTASFELMGHVGGILAIIGVVVLPITSGDTAFRAARLTIAESINMKQTQIPKRLMLAVPLFAIGIALSQIDFNLIWRYFGWANQTLAAIVLWAGAAYLYKKGLFHWICTVPAAFITAAVTSYICYEPTMGFGLPIVVSNWIGIGVTLASLVLFLVKGKEVIKGVPLTA
jgi:carbon starvation protein CstA